MKLQRQQRGITAFGVAFILMLIAFVVYTTLKLLPVYMEDFYVSGAMDGLEGDDAAEYLGMTAVREAVMKRLDINDVKQVKKGDIRIVRDSGIYNIDIDYEVRIPYAYNISMVMTFEHHAEVRAK